MKKIKSLFLAALTLLAVSCSSDALEQGNLADGKAHFSVQLPNGLNSRAACGDGTTATKLYYAVYEPGSTQPLAVANGQTPADMSGLRADVALDLVNGKTYDIVFWAQSPDAPYTFNPQGRTVDMNYNVADKCAANDEDRDAFFNIISYTHNGPATQAVELRRPFAQLNFATRVTDYNDAVASGIDPTTTSVVVKQLYPTLNLSTGEPTGTPVDVTFTKAALPTDGEQLSGYDAYKYMAKAYVLMGANRTTVDVAMTAYDAADETDTRVVEVAAVPVQRNYRTNIYGNLLCTSATFNVEIMPSFNDPAHLYEIWDGETVETPQVVDNVITISKPEQWVGLRRLSATQLINYTINLETDLDFGGYPVKSIPAPAVLNGNNHVIKNAALSYYSTDYSCGLIGGDALQGNVAVSDLTLENITIDSKNVSGGMAGAIFGDIQNGRTVALSNVHVKNSSIKGVNGVGGLCGYLATTCTLNINNCSVSGVAISNYSVVNESGNVAGFVGKCVGTVNGADNTIDNTSVNAYWAARRQEASVDKLVARYWNSSTQAWMGENKLSVTEGENVTISKTSIE